MKENVKGLPEPPCNLVASIFKYFIFVRAHLFKARGLSFHECVIHKKDQEITQSEKPHPGSGLHFNSSRNYHTRGLSPEALLTIRYSCRQGLICSTGVTPDLGKYNFIVDS